MRSLAMASASRRSVADAKGYRLIGLAIALLLGAAFFGVARWVGLALGNGFKLDWYVRPGELLLEPRTVALWAGIAGVAAAAMLAPLGASLAHSEWARRLKTRAAPPARAGARARGAHDVSLIAALVGLLPLATALLVFAGLYAAGVALVDGPRGLPLVLGAAAAFTAFASFFVAFTATGSALADGRIRVEPEDASGAFSKVALLAARFPKAVIAVLVALTLVAGYGITLVNTNVDVADVLPRGDPNTEAAHNLTEKFKSSFTLQVTFQLRTASSEVWAADQAKHMPFRGSEGSADNISDEVYVRAIDELVQYAMEYPGSPFVASVALSDFYKIINWTIAGGIRANESAFALPQPTDPASAQMYTAVDRGVWTAIPATADAVISPDFRQTAVLLTVAPTEQMTSKEIGAFALRIRDEYVKAAETDASKYKVFTGENAPKFSVDLPIANAHSSELASHDFRTLLPVVSVWIMVCLFIAFRSARAIAIAFSALALSTIATFGLMGYLGIALNTLNLTVIPLIMGVGIDYGIHTLNEFTEQRSRGKTVEQALSTVGARGFVALFVATLNTVVGLAVMIASPSLLIAELGILSCIAITASFIVTILFIPAALALAESNVKVREYRPSPLMGGIARVVSKHRILVAALILVVTVASFAAQAALTIEPFGDPPRNWLADDPLRQEHEEAIQGFYNSENDDVKANIIIFEGNINDPDAHRYMDAIEASLKRRGVGTELADGTEGRIIPDTLRTLPFLVRTYLTVRDGVPGAGGFILSNALAARFAEANPYPDSEAEIEALLKEVETTPLRGLGHLFFDGPENSMAMMTFSVKAASYEDAAEVWRQVQASINDNEALRPDSMQVSFFGNTAINYLFVAKELPWVAYMSVVSNVLVLAFVYIPTRQIRPTIVVGVLNFLTSIWWLAVLPDLGVGLAITLTLPLVFIYAIGSDYGLHLVLNAQETKDTEETFRTTGKAILFSAITTFGAFLIFTQMSNLAVRRTMIGTAAAIPVILIVTVLVVPLLYPVKKKRAEEPSRATHDVVSVPVQESGKKAKRTIVEMPPPRRAERAEADR